MSETHRITVSGRGEAGTVPDIATVNLGVSILAGSVAQASSEATSKASAVLEAVAAAGVDKADISTAHFSVQPEWDHTQQGRHLKGYRVRNQVDVVVRDVERTGAVIDAAAEAAGDAATVDGITLGVGDQTSVLDTAREAAWGNALAKAEHLARLAGRTVGPAIEIVESSDRHGPPSPVARLAMADAAPVEPGTATVAVVVNVTFELE